MSLDTETQGDTTTIEHFGREWTVPTKRHHTHIRKTKAILRQFGQMDADDVAEVFLSPEDYETHVAEALPNEQEKTFIRDLMKEPGWIAPRDAITS